MSITVNDVTWVQVALLIATIVTSLLFLGVLIAQIIATKAATRAANSAAAEGRRNRPVIIASVWGLKDVEITLLNAGASTAFDIRAIGEITVGTSMAIVHEMSGRDLVANSDQRFEIPDPARELGDLMEKTPGKLQLLVTALWADVPGEQLSNGSYFEFSNVTIGGDVGKPKPSDSWVVQQSMVSRPEGDLPDARKRAITDRFRDALKAD